MISNQGEFTMNSKSMMAILAMLILVTGCSREDSDEIAERTMFAAKGLNATQTHAIPNIVADQKQKENIRQNTQWTPENQALHPVEYCQAQLEELDQMARKLQVQSHRISMSKAETQRKQVDAKAQSEGFLQLLKDAKIAYRIADVEGKWPMIFNGFRLSKERAQQKIVDATQSIASLKSFVEKSKNTIAILERKSIKIDTEQRKLISVKERLQSTLVELKTKQVIDGTNGVLDALNAINDSISSLGTDASDPSLEDLVIPDTDAARAKQFNEIMAVE